MQYKRTTGRSDMSGELYEVKMVALLFVRCLKSEKYFHLASNMMAAGSFDDIVFKQGDPTFFLQLKHRKDSGKIYHSQLVQAKGNFSLFKYCKSYREMKQQWTVDVDLKTCGSIMNSRFIIYTNATLAQVDGESNGINNDWKGILNTGGTSINFTNKSHPCIYEVFESLPRLKQLLTQVSSTEDQEELLQLFNKLWNKPHAKILPKMEELNKKLQELNDLGDLSCYKEFLPKLWLFSGQAAENHLDDLIKDEIKILFGSFEVDTIYNLLLREIQHWWKNSDIYLTENLDFFQDILQLIFTNISQPILKHFEDINLKFHNDEIRKLKHLLPLKGKMLHIITKGNDASTIFSSLKVHQSLVGERHLLLNISFLQSCQREVLTLWSKWCTFLVVIAVGKLQMKSIYDILHKCPGKGLILIAETIEWNAQQYTYTTFHDSICIKQLDEESRKRVLNTTVLFQGHNVYLRELAGNSHESLNADIIFQLLTSEITVGNTLTTDLDYYIPRTLQLIDNKDSEFSNVSSIMDIPQNMVIVSADPGMGKSTLLTHIAQGTKDTCPAMWVVRVNLNDFTQQLDKLPEKLEISHVIDFFLKVSGITEMWKTLFTNKLQNLEALCILFDGYDEVRSIYSFKISQIFQFFKRSYKQKLWVTTRLITKQELEYELSSQAFTLLKFSEIDQKNFLSRFWKRCINIDDSLLDNFVTKFLHFTSKNLNDKDGEFMGNPLQSMLLAEAFEGNMRHYSDTGIITLPNKLDILELYERFVERKLKIYYEKNKMDMTKTGVQQNYDEMKETVYLNHMTLAIFTLLPFRHAEVLGNSEIISDAFETSVKKFHESYEKLGLIKEIVNDKAVFIHRTFSEYFGALWFSKNYNSIENSLKEKLYDENFKIVRHFFDRILCQKLKLHTAVINQDQVAVQNVLATHKFDTNVQDEGGRTALHLAVMNLIDVHNDDDNDANIVSEEIMTILLEHGAKPTISDNILGLKPLQLAERMKAWSAIDLLLQMKADSNDMILTRRNIDRDEYVQDMLKAATKSGLVHLVSFLLNCGIDCTYNIKGVKDNNVQLIHAAFEYRQFKLVKFLMDQGADLDQLNSKGFTLLQKASMEGKWKDVQTLVEMNANIDKCDKFGNTALHEAARKGKLDAVKNLIRAGSNVNVFGENGNTALHKAAQMGEMLVVSLLIEHEADLKKSNNDDNNVLHFAAMSGNTELVNFLLDRGLDIEACNNEQQTPLLTASENGKFGVVQLLLKRGADKTHCDLFGNMVQHEAALSGNSELVKYLVDEGLNIKCYNNDLETPLMKAAECGNFDIVKYIMKTETNLTTCDKEGNNVLHSAAWSGNVELVTHLMDSGLNFDCHNKRDETPLIWAARSGHLQVVQLLCKLGANLHAQDKETGFTPLHEAARSGHLHTVQFLVEQGANICASDKFGRTSHLVALQFQHLQIAEFLNTVESMLCEKVEIPVPD